MRKTAAEIGKELLKSAQEINNQIVKKGFATREPWGLKLTELGKKFGNSIIKVNRYGHTFENIEWDEKITELLFSFEELMDIKNKKTLAERILKGKNR